MVATFRHLEYLVWEGVDIYCDHRNLAYIFSPEVCVTNLSKATQRLLHWRTYLGQFLYRVQHILDVDNHWGDSLSRWRLVDTDLVENEESPSARCRTIALFCGDGRRLLYAEQGGKPGPAGCPCRAIAGDRHSPRCANVTPGRPLSRRISGNADVVHSRR